MLTAIEVMDPRLRLIRVFPGNPGHSHVKLTRAWLARPQCRIGLHVIPADCPHPDFIERLWGPMHRISRPQVENGCIEIVTNETAPPL